MQLRLVPLILASALSVMAAQNGNGVPPRRALVTQAVDNAQWIKLSGNTRSAANAVNDQGRVSDALPLEHMQLLLQRPPELQQALDEFTSDLQNPKSPSFHKWLTAAEFGEQFGVADSDIAAVNNWLQSAGFTVNRVYANKVMIDFSGTAGQVRQAFHTEIHNLNVNGEAHIANRSDPAIPAALAPVVAGVVSLHNFMPRSMRKAKPQDTVFTSSGTYEIMVPGDMATIYNLAPVLADALAGQGQTIAVLEDSDLYTANDWTTFRSKFGLSQTFSTGSLTTVHPGNCSDPGAVAGNDGEATLDAEWASAAAPGAAIVVASCKDTRTTFGGLIALQNLLNAGNPPAVMSISYGECEAENGATANAAYNSIYQQAVTAGVSIYVAAGDEGAASCDADAVYATHGLGVSGFASTPYNVAVGGTDFSDTFNGTSGNYWNADNGSTYASAKSYIPEIPWNDSCASSLIAATFGTNPLAFCNSATATDQNAFLNTAAGSGGQSSCATGTPTITGVVSGTCKGYAKPSWQFVSGLPGDGVRDLPDVSLFASNGIWAHYYVFCFSDTRSASGGASCAGDPSTWAGAGGTSFATPIWAGFQALVNQYRGVRVGNPNPYLYYLAGLQYGTSGTGGGSNCGSQCVFHDVVYGDNDLVCGGTTNCYGSAPLPKGGTPSSYGVLSYSSSANEPTWGTGTGWDFATGLGSVNVYNLILQWP